MEIKMNNGVLSFENQDGKLVIMDNDCSGLMDELVFEFEEFIKMIELLRDKK